MMAVAVRPSGSLASWPPQGQPRRHSLPSCSRPADAQPCLGSSAARGGSRTGRPAMESNASPDGGLTGSERHVTRAGGSGGALGSAPAKVIWQPGHPHRNFCFSADELPAHLSSNPLLAGGAQVSPLQRLRWRQLPRGSGIPLRRAAIRNLRVNSVASCGSVPPPRSTFKECIALTEKRMARTDNRLLTNQQKQQDHVLQRFTEKGLRIREMWSYGGNGEPPPLQAGRAQRSQSHCDGVPYPPQPQSSAWLGSASPYKARYRAAQVNAGDVCKATEGTATEAEQ